MAAYLIVRADITNRERYLEYTKVTPAIVAEFGGRFIVRGGQSVTLEGPEELRRIVVIEFPSLQRAVDCYQSSEYQVARLIREGAAQAEFVAVDGVSVSE